MSSCWLLLCWMLLLLVVLVLMVFWLVLSLMLTAIMLSALVTSCSKSFDAECHQTTLGTMPFSNMTLSIMILCLYAECRDAAERGGWERYKTNCFLSLFLKIKIVIKSWEKLFLSIISSQRPKLFTAPINECSLNIRIFVPGSPFKPGLMFLGKGKSLPLSVVPEKVLHNEGRLLGLSHRLGWKGQPSTNALAYYEH